MGSGEWGSGGVGEWGVGSGEWGSGGVGEWGSGGVGEWGVGEWGSGEWGVAINSDFIRVVGFLTLAKVTRTDL